MRYRSQITLVPPASPRRRSPWPLGSRWTSQLRKTMLMARMSSVLSSSRWEQDFAWRCEKNICIKICFQYCFSHICISDNIDSFSEESEANASWTSPALRSPSPPRTLTATKEATSWRSEKKSAYVTNIYCSLIISLLLKFLSSNRSHKTKCYKIFLTYPSYLQMAKKSKKYKSSVS